MNKTTPKQRSQRGAVLIISLIFLLVLSLIGVSSMQGTSVQELMSGNLRDQYIAFNVSEATLLEGETQAAAQYKSGTFDQDNPISGTYAASFAQPSAPVWNATHIESITSGITGNANVLGVMVKVDATSKGKTGTSNVKLESIYLIKGS